ncbi:hypothetical protein [Yoonia sp.]|uniref:hypothetical protein n=1 Tax=Yoonia sp. TaxID=2212373 RepID=UPI00358E9B8A
MIAQPAILPAPYAHHDRHAPPALTPRLKELTDAQVKALVAAAPAASELSGHDRDKLQDRLQRIAGHAAALALEDWQQSQALGQRPVVRTTETVNRPVARTQARGEFENAASSRVGEVTRSTLNAISFPEFVSDLIKGTFASIMEATSSQMDAYMKLLEQVSQTVEQFENENISDVQAHQWLAQQYPRHIRLEPSDQGVIAVATDGAVDVPDGIQTTLMLPDSVSSIDDITIEETLVPAARRKLAQSRLQMLSSLVMMGLQRIVINHGRIRATMGFHIDATDSASRSDASLLDTSVAAKGSVGFGPWSASVSTSVTYVRSTKSDSNAELNVNADLTGEVDLTFSTDYLPLNRMATDERIARIQNNTPNPAANAPAANTMAPRERPSTASDMLNTHLGRREAVEAPDLASIPRPPAANEEEGGNSQAAEQPAAAETESAPAASESSDSAPAAAESEGGT